MHTTNLRKASGSIMLTVSPVFLDQLHLQADAAIDLAIDHGCLVVNPSSRSRHTPAELLAVSDYLQS